MSGYDVTAILPLVNNQERSKLSASRIGQVFSETLKQRFNVSDNIIFNDIIYLEKAGVLKRIDAGAGAVEACSETERK
ncbi:DeoR family transcriptional regulator [Marinomonas sp. FW-1]|uniref:DeoR family transcriptional regulator n=1 Tax=Marinomonas sp. FW-1 TaxID=2071621 RepID=UPI0010C01FD7